MISDETLKKATAEADQAIRDSLPAPAECEHEFSPSFQRKMRRTFRKAKYGELKITKMYDADGNETSLYSQVYAKATSSGTSTLVTSGSWYDVPIPSSFQAASKSVSLYCKGHIPWIDCKISGYWNVH